MAHPIPSVSTLPIGLKRGAFAALLATIVLCALAVPSFAATLTVTSTADSGPGSLRDTIAAAASGDKIAFNLPTPAYISLTSGPIIIPNLLNLTIAGPGANLLTIDGTDDYVGTILTSMFEITGYATVAISGVGISTGSSNAPIQNYGGNLILDHDIFYLNVFGSPAVPIFNQGTMTVTNCVLEGYGADAMILNDGNGLLNVSDTAFRLGGALHNNGTAFLNRITLTNASIPILSVPLGSGGGSTTGIVNTANLYLTNSTISGQFVGIQETGINAITRVVNSTIAGNSYGIRSSADTNGWPSLILKNTVLTENFTSCAPYLAGYPQYTAGPASASYGHNFSTDQSCNGYFGVTDVGDPSVVLNLDSNLAYNGGPTPTVALHAGSAAIDAVPMGPTNYCTDIDGVTPILTDQRGMPRPVGAACDAGAYETGVLFASQKTSLYTIGSAASTSFLLTATVQLGATSNGINPAAEKFAFNIGGYGVTLAPGSFKAVRGGWAYAGKVSGVFLAVGIAPLGSGQYAVTVGGSPANFTGITRPALVTVLVGDDGGSSQAN